MYLFSDLNQTINNLHIHPVVYPDDCLLGAVPHRPLQHLQGRGDAKQSNQL